VVVNMVAEPETLMPLKPKIEAHIPHALPIHAEYLKRTEECFVCPLSLYNR